MLTTIIITSIIAGIAGFILCCLMVMANDDNYIPPRPADKFYKCKINPIKECKDMCCRECHGAKDCIWACEGNPAECGMSLEGQDWD